jgi:hypothetical protein
MAWIQGVRIQGVRVLAVVIQGVRVLENSKDDSKIQSTGNFQVL